jgi:uncharacterized protein YcfJ
MPKYKKEKEYSTSYEKKISINPMVEAFNMDEDNAPIAGAIGRGAKQVSKELSKSITKESPTNGRLMNALVKARTGHSNAGDAVFDVTKTAGALGAGYIAGKYDEKNSDSKSTLDEMGLEDEKLKPGKEVGMKKGGMVRGQGIALRGTRFKGIF